MENQNIDSRMKAGTLIYVGRRILRHEHEDQMKQEQMLLDNPEALPHVFIDFSGVPLKEVLVHAGGKQGCVVDTQKVVREGSTLNEVKAWRKHFREMETPPAVLKEAKYTKGDPFVIVEFKKAGTKLDVPKQPKDMLEAIKTQAPTIYEAIFASLNEEDQLTKVPEVYAAIASLS